MDEKELFVLITVKNSGGKSRLEFEYDMLERGLCKNARRPNELTESVLDAATRFTNQLIVASYGSIEDSYTLQKNVFETLEGDYDKIGQFKNLLKDLMKKGQPLEFVKLRWNVK